MFRNKIRTSKKGTEMSINVLVGIILGIIMFIAATVIFFRIMTESNKSSCELDQQTEDKMKIALDSGEPVYTSTNTIRVGEGCSQKNSALFWVGIRNIGDAPANFKINIECLESCPDGLVNSEIAYLSEPYIIPAMDNEFVRVAVNMKGVTRKATLLVTVKYANGTDYWRPKIINIQP
ncbi:MAG: hypothetical protein ACP5N2_05280 [Candidatus Nanoarchaeia archaeon]